MDSTRLFKEMDNSRTDLHIHSYYSDGLFSPQEIMDSLYKIGYRTLSITDHDGLKGSKEALALNTKENLRIIPGAEFSVEGPEGLGLHILAYLFNSEDRGLNQVIEEVRRNREERNLRLFDLMGREGIDLSLEDFAGMSNEDYVGKPLMAAKLKEKAYIKNYEDAFVSPGKYFQSPAWQAVKKKKLRVEKLIKVVMEAGGICFLAHPVKIDGLGQRASKDFWDSLDFLLSYLKGIGLSGLEAYYPLHEKEETESFLRMADRHGLLVSRGSDFHGKKNIPFLDLYGKIW